MGEPQGYFGNRKVRSAQHGSHVKSLLGKQVTMNSNVKEIGTAPEGYPLFAYPMAGHRWLTIEERLAQLEWAAEASGFTIQRTKETNNG